MSIEGQGKIPMQFLEYTKNRQELVSLDNGREILLSPRHATVLGLLQTAEGPLSEEDFKPHLKVVTSGIWKLNVALKGSGYAAKNVAPKRKGIKPQYVLIEVEDDQIRSKQEKKAKTKNDPESIEMARKDLAVNSNLVILSHLANDLMEKLTKDPTELLKGAHTNKQVPLACVIGDDPKIFLAKSLPFAFERLYNIDPKDKSVSIKEKQIAKFCNQLKEKGWQIQDLIDAVFKHFDIQNPDS